MLSVFLLFLFGIAAWMSWKNYSEVETPGRLILASAFTIAALLFGVPAILVGVHVAAMGAAAFFTVAIFGAAYSRGVNGEESWDEEDIDLENLEIVIEIPDDDDELEDDFEVDVKDEPGKITDDDIPF